MVLAWLSGIPDYVGVGAGQPADLFVSGTAVAPIPTAVGGIGGGSVGVSDTGNWGRTICPSAPIVPPCMLPIMYPLLMGCSSGAALNEPLRYVSAGSLLQHLVA
jgi:hypothetical protein